jgi:uncharacterized coiled-coil protein SlyX
MTMNEHARKSVENDARIAELAKIVMQHAILIERLETQLDIAKRALEEVDPHHVPFRARGILNDALRTLASRQ